MIIKLICFFKKYANLMYIIMYITISVRLKSIKIAARACEGSILIRLITISTVNYGARDNEVQWLISLCTGFSYL